MSWDYNFIEKPYFVFFLIKDVHKEVSMLILHCMIIQTKNQIDVVKKNHRFTE